MAAKKLSYYDKLKDPRWQKLRLEVMQHNEFRCECCMDNSKTLNVHHKEYFKDFEPWDYQIWQLACLCEECHENLHDSIDILKWVCSHATMDGPLNRTEIAMFLAGYMDISYSGILEFTGIDDHAAYRITHEVGMRANKIAHEEIMSDYDRRNPDRKKQ